MSKTKTRFRDLEWATDAHSILVLGAGGVSSWLALYLSRIGHQLAIYDFDSFEMSNLSGQLTSLQNLGLNKAQAIKNLTRDLGCDNIVHSIGTRYTEECESSNIVFSGIDSMAGRKMAFDKWVAHQKAKTVRDPYEMNMFMDFRMSPERAELYCITKPSQIAKYQATLFSDEDANELPCGMKATTHCGAMLAAQGVSVFNNHIMNKKYQFNVREVPFKLVSDLQNMDFHVES